MLRYFSFVAGQVEVSMIGEIQISRAVCGSVIADCQFVGFRELIFHFRLYISRISSFVLARMPAAPPSLAASAIRPIIKEECSGSCGNA